MTLRALRRLAGRHDPGAAPGGDADTPAPRGGAARGPVLVVRPHRVLVSAWIGAVATVAVFTVVAALLRTSDTGVYFRTADQVAMVLLGLLVAAGILLLARPRLRADARGIEVRNVGVPRYVPWELVSAVAFPDGASWARLDLPDDEYLPVLAVQAVDGQRAVAAMRQLRALHRAALATAARAPASGDPTSGAPASGAPASGASASGASASGDPRTGAAPGDPRVRAASDDPPRP